MQLQDLKAQAYDLIALIQKQELEYNEWLKHRQGQLAEINQQIANWKEPGAVVGGQGPVPYESKPVKGKNK